MANGDIDGRDTGTEIVTIAEAINNFINSDGDNNTTNGTGADNTGAAGSATGENSIKGDVAIGLISNYDGSNTAPTLLQYVDAGVTGVTVDNLAAANSAVANQTADTAAQIQTLTNVRVTNTATAITLGEASTGTYTVVLNTQPTGNVTITPASGDTDAAKVSGVMTFTTGNWNTAQTVTVTGVSDADTTDETVTISHAIAGNDYAAVTSADVIATVTDDDYPFAIVVIGTQTWSASNVSLVPTVYSTLGTHYWDAYAGTAGSAANDDGYYYTWDAADNVCPSGWRLPSDADWKTLEGFLGMSVAKQDSTSWRGTDEGTKLKVDGDSGFEAKLAGYRYMDGSFYDRGDRAFLWSSSLEGSSAWRRYLETGSTKVNRTTYNKAIGFSVRCLKD